MEEIPEFETLAKFMEVITSSDYFYSFWNEDDCQSIEERIKFVYNHTKHSWCINSRYQNKVVKIEGLFFLFYVDLSTIYGGVDWIMEHNPQFANAFIVLEPI